MRPSRLLVLFLFLMVSGLVHAQGALGSWQGTLPSTQYPRLVVRLARYEDGSLRGVFFRIDQSASSTPLTVASFQSPDLSLASSFVKMSYEGRLSPDGSTISGIWTENAQAYPLILTRATPATAWKHDPGNAVPPMLPSADPAFEVATIKPSAPGESGKYYRTRVRHFVAHDASVQDLVELAYKVRDRQLQGGPPWMKEAHFNIEAEPDAAGQPTDDQTFTMIRKLLADRFQLRFHIVQRPFPVYALTVARLSPLIVRSNQAFFDHVTLVPMEQPDGETKVEFYYARMSDLVSLLMNFIPNRQIVDETGLKDAYDFSFTIPTDVLPGHAAGTESLGAADAFYNAMEAQLGLRMVPRTEPLDVLVIDHLEQPSPN